MGVLAEGWAPGLTAISFLTSLTSCIARDLAGERLPSARRAPDLPESGDAIFRRHAEIEPG